MRCAFAAMITFVGVVTTASADQTEEARTAIAAEYRKWDAAFNHKDVRGATHCLAPNFVQVSPPDKPMTLAQYRQTITTLFGQDPSVTFTKTTKVGKIAVSGKSAIVMIRGHMVISATVLGKQYNTVFDSQMRDVWVRTGAGWRCTKSTELSGTRTNPFAKPANK